MKTIINNNEIQKAVESCSIISKDNFITVNELLYVLSKEKKKKGFDYNIQIGNISIPALDAFAPIKIRALHIEEINLDKEMTEEFKPLSVICLTLTVKEVI